MKRTARASEGLLRDVWLALAVLAIGLRILVPVGFMPGERADGQGFGLTICTAEGLVSAAPGDDHGKAPASAGHDGACVFAAHAVSTAETPAILVVRPVFAVASSPSLPGQTDLAPGRGLAAPVAAGQEQHAGQDHEDDEIGPRGRLHSRPP